ncbi:DNA-directed RNA polymerase subunit beta [Bacillus kwashiorkori]|uniref:DNA-directed RNA polymerase subunit beta n=1 Tax=Bacillus kwashiorkori TaxID=1522318 RepID=UPI0008F80758|nr:DNA-directed RNA polymerase subunit beta [Bacillus kwashiorkori]
MEEKMKKIEGQSREERRKIKLDKQKEEVARKPRRIRIRLIPIWLRVIIVLILVVTFFMIGTMIGYGIIGDGNPTDVFKKSTWTHITDIVNKK